LLCIRVADRNDLAVTDVGAKYIKVAVQGTRPVPC
jgi:hypothetical protein